MTERHRTRGPTVAVIGAGLAGLATGIFLQLNGYHAHLFEHASAVGGVALTRWTPEATVEGGAYFLFEHAPGLAAHAVYQTLGAMPPGGVETLELYTCVIDQLSGARLAITRDLDALARDLKALAPDDAAKIDELIAGSNKFAQFDPARAGLEKPPELHGVFDKVSLGWQCRHVLGIMSDAELTQKTLAEWLAPMKSATARRILETVFPHASVPPWFVMMLLGLLARGQLGQITCGPEAFVASIKQRFLSLGGEVTLNATVAEITVREGRAVGITLARGDAHPAHAVVSTVDTRQLTEGLLGGRIADRHAREHLSHWKTTSPPGIAHFVTRGHWNEVPWFVQARLGAPFEVAGGTTDLVTLRFCPEAKFGAGPGESVVEFVFDTDFARWRDPSDPQREALESEVMRRAEEAIESMFQGFRDRVLRRELVTPDVFARALRAPEGVTSAWVPEPEVVNATCPRKLEGLENVYLAGQWAVGGAGILAVLFSGRQAVQLLCHDDGVPFSPG